MVLWPHCDSIAKSNRLVSGHAASGGVLLGGRGGSFPPAVKAGSKLKENLAPLAVLHVHSGCVGACLHVDGSQKLCGASELSCLVPSVLIFVSAFRVKPQVSLRKVA